MRTKIIHLTYLNTADDLYKSTKLIKPHICMWYAMAQLVEALRYKPEGRGFDSRWGYWNFLVI
jgi:hypothetical protein